MVNFSQAFLQALLLLVNIVQFLLNALLLDGEFIHIEIVGGFGALPGQGADFGKKCDWGCVG